MTSRLADYPNIIRNFNGIILLARNLVSVDGAIQLAWESKCIQAIFELFGAILADKCAANEDNSSGSNAPFIQKIMSESPSNESFYEKVFVSCQQFFSNLSVQATKDSNLAEKIFKLFWDDLPFSSMKMWLFNTPAENSVPILLLIKHLVTVSQENCGKLAETTNGQLCFQFILDHADTWLTMKNDMFSHLLYQIVILLIENGYATVIVRKSLEGMTSLNPEQTYTFLKLLNSGVTLALEPRPVEGLEDFEDFSSTDSNSADDVRLEENVHKIQKTLGWSFELEKTFFDDLFKIFEMVKKEAMPFITTAPSYEEAIKTEKHHHENHLKLVTNTWYVLNLLLDVFESILTVGSPNKGFEDECLSKRSIDMYKYILHDTPFLDSLTNLLHTTEKHLPKRNKLKDFMDGVGSSSVKPDSKLSNGGINSSLTGTTDDNITDIYSNPYRHLEFPLLKAKIIFIIGLLTNENKMVQDKMREIQVLEIILNNMMIDLNNPFIKENSVLTLSALLKNNPENQAIVANLKQQEVVKEEELEKAGYEVNIVDGNVRLKQKMPRQ